MYYTLIIQNDNTQAVYAYNTLNEAKAKYHQELAYRAEGRTSTKCAILSSDLAVILRDEYHEETTETEHEG